MVKIQPYMTPYKKRISVDPPRWEYGVQVFGEEYNDSGDRNDVGAMQIAELQLFSSEEPQIEGLDYT